VKQSLTCTREEIVKPRHAAILAGALLGLAAAPAFAQGSKEWVEIKDPTELRALFANTTFKGRNQAGDAFTAYNHVDGMRQLVISQMDFMQHWRINGGEACFQIRDRSTPETCLTYSKHSTRKGEYQSRRAKDGAISSFALTPGTKGARKY
jgi:hypothetical protein